MYYYAWTLNFYSVISLSFFNILVKISPHENPPKCDLFFCWECGKSNSSSDIKTVVCVLSLYQLPQAGLRATCLELGQGRSLEAGPLRVLPARFWPSFSSSKWASSVRFHTCKYFSQWDPTGAEKKNLTLPTSFSHLSFLEVGRRGGCFVGFDPEKDKWSLKKLVLFNRYSF